MNRFLGYFFLLSIPETEEEEEVGREEENDSAAFLGLVCRRGIGFTAFGEDPIEEAGDHGLGSGQERERPDHGEDDRCDGFCRSEF